VALEPKTALLSVALVVIAGGSFVVSQGPHLGAGQPLFRPGVVFGAVVSLLFVSVGFTIVFESARSIDEGWTIIDFAVASAWALYLGAGLALFAAGVTRWQVLAHLTIAVGAGIVFLVGYASREE